MAAHSSDSLLVALRNLVEKLGPNITLHRFRQETGIPYYYVYEHWGNWTRLRRAAGLPARARLENVYSDDELLAEYHRVATRLNAFPGINDFNRLSPHSWNSLAARFGKHPDIHRAYRDWLARYPEETVPLFLRDCPENCQPTDLPGLFVLRDDILQQVLK